jgi:hypothetical protein
VKDDLEGIRMAVKAMREMGSDTMAQAYAWQKLGRLANEILGKPKPVSRLDRLKAWVARLARSL